MGVNKNFITLFLLVAFTTAASAQTKRSTFHFKDESLSQALQDIADKFDLYLSYNPKLFLEEPNLTADVKSKTLTEALSQLLHPKFEFEIIESYIVIKKAPEIKKAPPVAEHIVYDTIRIEEKIIQYDTQRVEITVYDTMVIEKPKYIYDTVKVEKKVDLSNQKWRYSIYASPNIWFTSEKNDKAFKGIATGFQASYSLKNLSINATLEYNYLLRNIQYSTSEMMSNTRIDTLSTYFIIENGERIPVYVTDTVRTEYESIQNIDRSDNAQRISLSLSLGYIIKKGKISVELCPGILYSRTFRDEQNFDNNTASDNVIITRPQSYQVDASLSLPIYFNSFRESKLYVSPYAQYGLSHASSFKRYNTGLRLGIIF
ncbi:hypothetical protein [Fulvivirga ligni]|uniref:hypothetical protein n=1 Tax=Fulvivirga ligni TaxID=2904246 RepID=UPI001F3D9176|nr:hypothetical protein [Fulvivirga ligni]UII21386.1 hypothetical protein LVD16_26515 [Fulvivirga ligni]